MGRRSAEQFGPATPSVDYAGRAIEALKLLVLNSDWDATELYDLADRAIDEARTE